MATMPMKMNPMETQAEDASEMRMSRMSKGALPGLNKLPRGAKAKKGMKKGR